MEKDLSYTARTIGKPQSRAEIAASCRHASPVDPQQPLFFRHVFRVALLWLSITQMWLQETQPQLQEAQLWHLARNVSKNRKCSSKKSVVKKGVLGVFSGLLVCSLNTRNCGLLHAMAWRGAVLLAAFPARNSNILTHSATPP